MKPRISMITLGVNDLPRMVAFYRDGLGFPQLESPPEVAFFTLAGCWLGLYGRAALAARAGAEIVKPAQKVFWGGPADA
jgi:catechol 2,3-dioxygenase-like lactoylglutathione lyase family enzyme